MYHFHAHYSRHKFGVRYYRDYGSKNYFLGIDAGTSSVKSLLINEDGHVIDIAKSKYGVIRQNLNWAEQDISGIWRACLETLNNLNKNNPGVMRGVKAVGFSGQMHGLVMLDAENQPLRNAIIWEDQRSSHEIKKIYDLIGRDEFCSLTLNSLSTGYLITSLMWVKENEPELFSKIKNIMFVKDYLRFKLCNEIGTDVTDASGSVIFDTAKREWAWDFIKKLDLPDYIFPECHEAHETAGEITPEAAKLTGLKAGTPIVYGGGDTLMLGVGTGIISKDGNNSIAWGANIGTGCQVLSALNQPFHDKNFRTNTFCYINSLCGVEYDNKPCGVEHDNKNENLWMLMGANLCGGAAMRWFAKHVLDNIEFSKLDEIAKSAPAGSDGVIFMPFLNGSRINMIHDANGIFAGLSLSHDKSHMARSIVEGVIFSMRDAYDILKEIANSEPDRIIASGGGAVSDLALQIEADIFNKPVYTTIETEEACIGAALTAAVGTGFYKSFDEACGAAVRFSDKIIEPDDNADFYNERFEFYKDLFRRNFENFNN